MANTEAYEVLQKDPYRRVFRLPTRSAEEALSNPFVPAKGDYCFSTSGAVIGLVELVEAIEINPGMWTVTAHMLRYDITQFGTRGPRSQNAVFNGSMSMNEPILIDADEAGRLLDMLPRLVARFAKQGLLPYVALPDRQLRFLPNDLREWAEQCRILPLVPSEREADGDA
jgi:hypothetical protein